MHSAHRLPPAAGVQRGRRLALFGVLTLGAAVWLASGEAALAAEGDEPAAALPAVAVPEPAPAAALQSDPAPAPPAADLVPPVPEISVTSEGNVNVSVRVASPGNDGPVAQEVTSGAAISPAPEADITGSPGEPAGAPYG